MPHTLRVRASFAGYLLATGDEALRRRLAILRDHPFPPGSRAVAADDESAELETLLKGKRAFLFGSFENAVVYTYDSPSQSLEVEFGVVQGRVVGRAR